MMRAYRCLCICIWLYDMLRRRNLSNYSPMFKAINNVISFSTCSTSSLSYLFHRMELNLMINRVTVWCLKACHDRLINVRECLTHHNPNSWQKTLIELLEFWSPCIKLLVAIYLNLCLALNRWICKPILWVKYLS